MTELTIKWMWVKQLIIPLSLPILETLPSIQLRLQKFLQMVMEIKLT